MAIMASRPVLTSSITTGDGAIIPYKISGPSNPNAPLIVLSNPLLVTWSIWDPFLAALPHKTNLRILRYLTRGRTSHFGSKDITLDVLADDLKTLLDAVGCQQAAAIIGVSVGGATVLNFGLKYPTRTAAIVCGGTFAKSPPGMQQMWEQRIAVGRREGEFWVEGDNMVGRDLAEQLVRRCFVPASFDDESAKHEIQSFKELVATGDLDGFEAAVKAVYDFDLREATRSASEDIRATFVAGSEDSSVPAGVMKEMARSWGQRGAYFALIEGAGQFPMVEKAEKFARIVTASLEEI